MAETKFTFNFNITTILLIAAIILMGVIGYRVYDNKVDSLKEEIQDEVKLRNALTDTVHKYRNNEGILIAEKKTIQADIKKLESINENLTQNQRDLYKRIKSLDKENKIISAALIESYILIDSLKLKGKTTIDTSKATVEFSDTYIDNKKTMRYGFTVRHVLPSSETIVPTLTIDSLLFPNKQFIEFHWVDDKKEGYPVTFTVSNSNDFFQTGQIDSYAIPNINKDEIDPNFGKKISNFIDASGNRLVWGGVGVLVGATAILLLTK